MSKRDKAEKKKSRRGLVIFIAVLSWLLLMASLTVLADSRTVRFYMTGEEEMNIEQGSEYTEPGVYVVSSGRIFGEGKKHLDIITRGTVDSSVVGSYSIEYTVASIFGSCSTSRTVNVVDTQAPTIELNYVQGYEPSWIDGYVEEGYTAFDSYDGDIT